VRAGARRRTEVKRDNFRPSAGEPVRIDFPAKIAAREPVSTLSTIHLRAAAWDALDTDRPLPLSVVAAALYLLSTYPRPLSPNPW
jgi:hypothetical protein